MNFHREKLSEALTARQADLTGQSRSLCCVSFRWRAGTRAPAGHSLRGLRRWRPGPGIQDMESLDPRRPVHPGFGCPRFQARTDR